MGRRQAQAPVTFFSFQDVLLSLIGITILVTVLLIISSMVQAVETVEHAISAAAADPASAELTKAMEDRRDQLIEVVRRAERRQHDDPAAKRATLRQELLASGEALDDLEREVAELEKALRDLILRHPDAGSAKRYMSLEQQRQELESQLEREQRRRQVTYLLGDLPQGVPVGTEVSARGFVVFSLEQGKGAMLVSATAGITDLKQVAATMAGGKPFYMLFIVKPSGIDHFRAMVAERAQLAEADRPPMGLDLVAETAVVVGALPGAPEGAP